ncbi:acyl-CoA dehydrogenase [Pseudoclavibacter sp. AY1F1]|uniref:acyl-CoA dehydrogenase family protein n=1 Tax=Pseudoclavibacter sp. AY1F1 TaxID=2080583 RepID=UPI000CE8FA1B|nr:acyl-CoA dehydrogenase family protein [Pseudoclavibacter sp. AY1F1]PPF42359.1 acyl-CoA dehydrogenase [Pseudoclavibacter sp. AY1F1]
MQRMIAERLQDALLPFQHTLREHALAIDSDPRSISRVLDSGVPFHQFAGLPREFASDPLRVDGEALYLTSCEERVIATEILATGDASMVVGAPGASMSGVLIDALGSNRQRERFYSRVAERPIWTFFGLTEPNRGSDAASLETLVDGDGSGEGRLIGHKKFVGNAARAEIGVVFARFRPGPLGIGAVLVETDRRGFEATPLKTLGFRGVQLSEIQLDAVPVVGADLLGEHLTPSRRGILGAVQVFNALRPVVGALGLGIASAGLDYVRRERRSLRQDEAATMENFDARLQTVRALVRRAAALVDNGQADGAMSSAAKVLSVELASAVTQQMPRLVGGAIRWEHPYLDKLRRDVGALELMEGTSLIQRQNVATGYLQRGLGAARVAK